MKKIFKRWKETDDRGNVIYDVQEEVVVPSPIHGQSVDERIQEIEKDMSNMVSRGFSFGMWFNDFLRLKKEKKAILKHVDRSPH